GRIARRLRRRAGCRVVDVARDDAHLIVGERPEDEVRLDTLPGAEALTVDAVLSARARVAEGHAFVQRVDPADARRRARARLAAHLLLDAVRAVRVRARVPDPRVAVLGGVGAQQVAVRQRTAEGEGDDPRMPVVVDRRRWQELHRLLAVLL